MANWFIVLLLAGRHCCHQRPTRCHQLVPMGLKDPLGKLNAHLVGLKTSPGELDPNVEAAKSLHDGS